MKITDKFLFGIIAGVVVLIGVAFAMALMRSPAAYRADDTPEGVAHNYLLALQNEEYQRAYGYISPSIKGYPPSLDHFTRDVRSSAYGLSRTADSRTIEVGETIFADDKATVLVYETVFNQGGLFSSSQYSSQFDVLLQREGDQWRITSANPYWAWCWNEVDGCQN